MRTANLRSCIIRDNRAAAAAPVHAEPAPVGEGAQPLAKEHDLPQEGGLIDRMRRIAFDLRDDFKDITTIVARGSDGREGR